MEEQLLFDFRLTLAPEESHLAILLTFYEACSEMLLLFQLFESFLLLLHHLGAISLVSLGLDEDREYDQALECENETKPW